MAKGIFCTKKKDGSTYYRSSINRRGKKISLGSFDEEKDARKAYKEAVMLYEEDSITLENYSTFIKALSFDKVVSLINLRDKGFYFKTPIYLREGYFSYFLEDSLELKFDNEDLFYYSSHTIMKRGGHLFVNDYGAQYSLTSRYGIKPYAVLGRDYRFVNGDENDFRYENILIINRFTGVRKRSLIKKDVFYVKIHINGEFSLGRFDDELEAAVCYNKGADLVNSKGLKKDFVKNYIEEYTSEKYKEVYEKIRLPERFINYINLMTSTSQSGSLK